MPVSTECAAALLCFRYPSFRSSLGATFENFLMNKLSIILGYLKDSNAAAHSVDTGIS